MMHAGNRSFSLGSRILSADRSLANESCRRYVPKNIFQVRQFLLVFASKFTHPRKTACLKYVEHDSINSFSCIELVCIPSILCIALLASMLPSMPASAILAIRTGTCGPQGLHDFATFSLKSLSSPQCLKNRLRWPNHNRIGAWWAHRVWFNEKFPLKPCAA
jgi:hypothetical protein